MARLYLFAEGPTEQTFADTVLKPHLANRGVYLHPPVCIAHARKKGRVHRGGGRSYVPMKNDILRFLRQEQSSDVFFTTMIDLYGIHAGFPGLTATDALHHLPRQRVESLERAFGEDVGDSRFIPYIQLHEFEAYLFSDPTQFECFYRHKPKQIETLCRIAASKESPELIDDGQHSAPSKRIVEQFADYAGAKPVVGPKVAELIGLDRISEKCPHFAKWLQRLERLASHVR